MVAIDVRDHSGGVGEGPQPAGVDHRLGIDFSQLAGAMGRDTRGPGCVTTTYYGSPPTNSPPNNCHWQVQYNLVDGRNSVGGSAK